MRFSAIIFLSLVVVADLAGQSTQQKMLEVAFKKNSQKEYVQFLEEWAEKLQAISNSAISKKFDFEKYVYEIFKLFYQPKKLTLIGKSEFGESIYKDVRFVIIQNKIEVGFIEKMPEELNIFSLYDSLYSRLEILDFRPDVVIDDAKILYLTSFYEEILSSFLGTEYSGLGEGGIMNPSRAKGTSAKKLDFLNQQVRIFHGHWGGYWHLETHPFVSSIIFNREQTEALVNFRLVYQGGQAFFKRSGDSWQMMKSGMTWIE